MTHDRNRDYANKEWCSSGPVETRHEIKLDLNIPPSFSLFLKTSVLVKDNISIHFIWLVIFKYFCLERHNLDLRPAYESLGERCEVETGWFLGSVLYELFPIVC